MPRNRLSPHSTPMHSKPRLSIRARLMLLALLAVIPLMLDRVRLLETTRSERIDTAYAEVVDFAKRGAEAQLEVINSTRALLQVVARAYITLTLRGQSCTSFLAGFATDVPWIKGLSIVGPDGRITCSTRPYAVGLDVSDREHIQTARRTREFVLSDYLIERTNNQPSIIAAYPTLGTDDSVNAIILAPVDLKWLGRLASVVEQRTGAAAYLIDGQGTVLAGFQGRDQLVGRRFADHPLVRDVLSRSDGTVTTNGLDGVRRIFAFMRLPGTETRIVIGLDEREVLSRIEREIGIAYLQLVLFGLLTLMVAWFCGERLIVKPIRALARTAGRIGRGDLEARLAPENWATEFAPLAAALADMAMKLAERERELRSANRHLEELASIDSLSGLANRRSFDERFKAEWHHSTELKRPIGLLMIDVDHFKLFNDRYGHLKGDHCLRRIGEALASLSRGNADFAARYGGEEFVLLLANANYQSATEIVWCQEEPRNQGAWRHIQHYLLRHLLPHQKLFYAGRESSASPAAGYKSLHDKQQKALVDQALTMSGGTGPRVLEQQPRPLSAGEEN